MKDKMAYNTRTECEQDKHVQPRQSHACPYAEEIHDSTDEHYCFCCEECTHECAMDV